MIASNWVRWGSVGVAGLALVAAASLPNDPPVFAQASAKEELPDGLRFVPADAALFAYADADKVWNSDIVKGIRKADAPTIGLITGAAKAQLGIAPEDVKSVVLFVPSLKDPRESESVGVVVTFKKGFDKDQLQKGVANLLPKDAKPKVFTPDARTAVVLINLDEEKYGKPQPAKAGPLTETLKAAAGGKYAAVVGATLANLPDELRGDNLPGPLLAMKPLFNSVTVSGTLDLAKDPTLEVVVKTGTAGQAVECEKSLGALLALIEKGLAEDVVKQLEADAAKDPGMKDVLALVKAVAAATKKAKFATLGNETRLTLSLPADLPFAGAFVGARKKVQESAAVARSTNNLKQIGLAYHNYHDTYGSGPPAAVCDKTGKPLLSWRVLILPYIEQNELFKQFKLDEPWDSEHNKKLLAKMPPVYAIPGVTKPGDTDTYYRVFVGNGAGWDWLMGTRLQQIADGTSNTIMCVTAAEAVPWTKPDELEFDPKKDMTKLLGFHVNNTAQAAYFDGSVRVIRKAPKKETLNALITKSGGEVIADDF
jgi:hypothetical protein